MRYVRNQEVEAAPMMEETVLYHPAANQFCVLNRTAAFIWERLEQPTAVTELAENLGAAFDAPGADSVQQDLKEALRQFEELGLIAPSE